MKEKTEVGGELPSKWKEKLKRDIDCEQTEETAPGGSGKGT